MDSVNCSRYNQDDKQEATPFGTGGLWDMLMDQEEEDDDDDAEEQLRMAFAAIAASTTSLEEQYSRAPFEHVQDHLNWTQHALQLVYQDRFCRNYRVP